MLLLLYACTTPSDTGAETDTDASDTDTSDTDTSETDSDTSDTDTTETTPSGCHLVASPTSLDMGPVQVGGSSIATVELENTGADSCEIYGADLVDPSAPFAIGPVGSVLLPTGYRTTFAVTFKPHTAEEVNTEVLITSNDQDPLSILVTGSGIAPLLLIDPLNYDFGSCDIGTDQAVQVTLSNIGNADLEVVDLSFITASSDLSMDANEKVNGPLPWILMAGEQAEVYVHYAPVDNYADEGYLMVTSDDPVQSIQQAHFLGSTP